MGKTVELPVQNRQRPPEGVGDIIRQTVLQSSPSHAGLIGRPHFSRSLGGALCQKILHPLGGSHKAAASRLERGTLPLLLEAHSRQWVGAEGLKILRTNSHQEAAVDVLSIPAAVAHAVGHQLARL